MSRKSGYSGPLVLPNKKEYFFDNKHKCIRNSSKYERERLGIPEIKSKKLKRKLRKMAKEKMEKKNAKQEKSV